MFLKSKLVALDKIKFEGKADIQLTQYFQKTKKFYQISPVGKNVLKIIKVFLHLLNNYILFSSSVTPVISISRLNANFMTTSLQIYNII